MSKFKFLIPPLCFILIIIIFRLVIFIGHVPSESMEPTIPAGSTIIGIRIFSELHKGDIVIFKHDNTYMVKRIAAVPGETIENSITGELLTVPPNSYYVLGDNVAYSYDSRYWKNPYVIKSKVIAKIYDYMRN